MSLTKSDRPELLELPDIRDSRGCLSFVQTGQTCPFDIRRIYYMYGMPENAERGAHAHLKCRRQLIAMYGSFDITLEWKGGKETFRLDRPTLSLLVPALAWITYRPTSPDAVLLALASEPYEEADYIRDYSGFKDVMLSFK